MKNYLASSEIKWMILKFKINRDHGLNWKKKTSFCRKKQYSTIFE